MKKLFLLVLCAIICSIFLANVSSKKQDISINDKLIRFHVVANSDLNKDQWVKLKVRDAILKALGPKLSKSSSREESLRILQENLEEIQNIANNVLKQYGQSYSAKAMIGDFTFPIKKYGTITLPAGQYKALKVVLGNGEGKNWWCVMFPPLCFIDITRGLTSEKTDEELRKILNDEEVESITAFKQEPQKQEVVAKVNFDGKNESSSQSIKSNQEKSSELHPNVEFKYKSVEVFEEAFAKIKSIFY
jgi:stage II sporulation protein R